MDKADKASNSELKALLDLNSAQISDATKKEATRTESWLKYLGLPLSILVFSLIYFMPTPNGLMVSGQIVLASFAMALVLWLTEPIPAHITSIILMCFLVVLGGWDEESVLGTLGLDVIWLNLGSFILCSVLVVTGVAKRVAMMLIYKFGKTAMTASFAFIVVQFILAPLIPATAARTVMTLPLMVLVAAIFGSTENNPNNFGSFLMLNNLHGISIFSSAFLTGSACNIIATGLIFTMTGTRIYYTDWLLGALPIALVLILLSWWIGGKVLFKMPREKSVPQISGGREALKEELDKMGPWSFTEKKAGIVFLVVVFLWVTDRWHVNMFGFEISIVITALIGAVFTLIPKVGIIEWKQANIPWHLLIFSAGAYAGGLALNQTDAARWLITKIFDAMNLTGRNFNYWVVYTIIMAVMVYSAYFFTSKTMRTLIMIPIIVAIADAMGYNPVWFALPASFTLCWVIGFPFSAKPNLILYSTGQYNVIGQFWYGFIVKTLGIILLVLFGMTWFRLIGIAPPIGHVF